MRHRGGRNFTSFLGFCPFFVQRNEPFLSYNLHPPEGNPLKHSLIKGRKNVSNKSWLSAVQEGSVEAKDDRGSGLSETPIFVVFPVCWKKGKDPHPQDKIQHLNFTKDPRPLYYKTPPCAFYHKNVRSKAVFGPLLGHTPSTAGTFRKKFRKKSGKTPETLSERFLEFPQYGWGRLFFQKWLRRGPLRAGHGIYSSTEGISD